MNVPLTIRDRILLLHVLSTVTQGKITEMRIRRDLEHSLAPTEDEIKRFEIKTNSQGITTWKEEGETVEIEVGDVGLGIIRRGFKILDDASSINDGHLNVIDKLGMEDSGDGASERCQDCDLTD